MSALRAADRLVRLGECPSAARGIAREIYEAGFPAGLRAPFRELADVRPDERTQLLLDAAGSVLGLSVVRDLGETPWTFLRYFVVSAPQRRQGVGGRLWDALSRDLAGRGRTRLIFDVEDPHERGLDPAEHAERRRRVEFYRRHGAGTIETASYAPPHHGQSGASAPALRLMGASIDASGHTTPLRLDDSSIKRLIAVVMVHRYADPVGPGDPA